MYQLFKLSENIGHVNPEQAKAIASFYYNMRHEYLFDIDEAEKLSHEILGYFFSPQQIPSEITVCDIKCQLKLLEKRIQKLKTKFEDLFKCNDEELQKFINLKIDQVISENQPIPTTLTQLDICLRSIHKTYSILSDFNCSTNNIELTDYEIAEQEFGICQRFLHDLKFKMRRILDDAFEAVIENNNA